MLMLLALTTAAGARAGAEPASPEKRDELVYRDGDRVRGKFVRREGDTVVFESERFGLLRVPEEEARVVRAKPPATPAAPKTPQDGEAEAGWTLGDLSPLALARSLRAFFGPWGGRVAVSTEIVSDSNERNSYSVDTHLQRKWTKDEVQISARYDYSKTNGVVTTDTLKSSGSWRHDFNKWRFAQYRPTVEWNRAGKRGGLPNDYVLLQQEAGAGFNLLLKPKSKVRAGASANLFDVWNSAPAPEHDSRAVASMFEETDFSFPWRIKLTQRGVAYPVPGKSTGWENKIEVNKKLTETLSVAVKHEMRRDSPDGSAQDYSRLKLLLGVDF